MISLFGAPRQGPPVGHLDRGGLKGAFDPFGAGALHGPGKDQELHVIVRIVAWLEQIALRGIAQRPVQVLTRTVDARERLLVQQAFHSVLLRDLLQGQHHELLVIGRDVGVFIDRRDFVLRRGHFVVASLEGNTDAVEFTLDLGHDGVGRVGIDRLLHRAEAGTATSERRACLLYTSDAADERTSVDLGGRRFIKKKNNRKKKKTADNT